MDIHNKMFPHAGYAKKDEADDPLPTPHLGFHMFALVSQRTKKCTSGACTAASKHRKVRDFIGLDVETPCQEALDEILLPRSATNCKVCKHDLSMIQDEFETIPPFLLFEVNEQRVVDDIEAGVRVQYHREVEERLSFGDSVYELICTMHNVGSHFIAYAKFPKLQHVEEGIYRFDDLQGGLAQEVAEFGNDDMPVMLIYRKI